ncbi:MAG: Ig domain-containing protein [Erysipelotrichaceae bacterium]|nr:Ig domain-containing protein [Erysipelotrichaceae bacterium]
MKKIVAIMIALLVVVSLGGCKPDEPVKATEITFAEGEKTFKEKGETYQIQATVKPDNTADKTLKYVSNDTGVCTVNDQGLVTAVGRGETTITVSCGEVSANFKVKVDIVEVTAVYYNVLADSITSEQYYPTLTLYSNGTFSYLENFYSGMVNMTGTYTLEDGKYVLSVKESKIGQESTNIDYPQIILVKESDEYLILKTGMVMSLFDDVLSRSKEVKPYFSYYMVDEAFVPEAYTAIHIYTNRTYELSENYFEGYEIVKGVYDTDNNGKYHFYVMEDTGRTGHNYNNLTMQLSEEGFELLSDLYIYKKGDVFQKNEFHLGK